MSWGWGRGGPGWRERRGGLKPATDLLFAQLCRCGRGLMDAEGEEPVNTEWCELRLERDIPTHCSSRDDRVASLVGQTVTLVEAEIG